MALVGLRAAQSAARFLYPILSRLGKRGLARSVAGRGLKRSATGAGFGAGLGGAERSVRQRTSSSASHNYVQAGAPQGHIAHVRGSRRKFRGRRFRRRRLGRFKLSRKDRKYVRRIAKRVCAGEAVNTWRDIASGQVSWNVNQCNYGSAAFLTTGAIEDAIDQAKVMESDGAGGLQVTSYNLTTADSKKIKILNAKSTFTFKNNGHSSAYLELFWFGCRSNSASALTPLTLWEDSLEDKGITVNETTDLRFNLWDGKDHMWKNWRCLKHRRFQMNMGDEVHVSLNRRRMFDYNPDWNDQESIFHIKGITQYLVWRVHGVVSHDTNDTANVGTVNGKIDYVYLNHIKFNPTIDSNYKQLTVGSGALGAQANTAVHGAIDAEETKHDM